MNGGPDTNSDGSDLDIALLSAGLNSLTESQRAKFEAYLSLIQRWNARMNLTSIRTAQDIVRRHFVESIACAQTLPSPIQTLLDFGSGAGFPGIPIAICRPEIAVTLAESQGKKAAFLQEAIRTLGLSSHVWTERGEKLGQVFDCVVLRAVDRMDAAIASATGLVRSGGWLGLLISRDHLEKTKAAAGEDFDWLDAILLPGSERRMLVMSRRQPK